MGRHSGVANYRILQNRMTTVNSQSNSQPWADDIHRLFGQHQIELVSLVPDSGHKRLIKLCQADPQMRTVTLATEEEGVALAAGAFLGGKRAALLMQSSGVGNCINMLSLPRICNMPFVTLVTMRGEWGEFNPWQVPMGQSVTAVLQASGVIVYRINTPADVINTIDGALRLAFQSRQRVAILLSQQFIGAKSFVAEGNE
jgi:sulfopyruvate decarboxylase alpha subunit